MATEFDREAIEHLRYIRARLDQMSADMADVKADVSAIKRRPGRPRKDRRDMRVFLDHISRTVEGFSINSVDEMLAIQRSYGGDGSRSIRRNRRLAATQVPKDSVILAGEGQIISGQWTRIVFLLAPPVTLETTPTVYVILGTGWHWNALNDTAEYNQWRLSFSPLPTAALETFQKQIGPSRGGTLNYLI
jgi:hypothetical protein